MDIVNAHVHMIELEKMVEASPDLAMPADIAVFQDLETTLPMLLPETLIAQMDEAGVTKSVLYAVEAPIVYATNEYVHALCKGYPDRLIGFGSVRPDDPNAPETLERAVKDLGLQGLKLHPPLQNFFPNDEAMFPVYAKCVELNIPVVFHVGTTPFGALVKLSQANPLLIDDIAVRFPDLRIMLTHLGTLWHNEAFMVVEKNPNVFIDTAAYVSEIETILTPDIVRRIGPDKIIFGTDYPMPYAGEVHRMKDFVDCIRGLPLDQSVLEGIFAGNFERLLHGRAEPAPMITVQGMMEKVREMMAAARRPEQDSDSGRT
jgi:uncharacterized protein